MFTFSCASTGSLSGVRSCDLVKWAVVTMDIFRPLSLSCTVRVQRSLSKNTATLFDLAVSLITGHPDGPDGDSPCSPLRGGSVYVDKSESHSSAERSAGTCPSETGVRVFRLRSVPSQSLTSERQQSTTSSRFPTRSTSTPSGHERETRKAFPSGLVLGKSLA